MDEFTPYLCPVGSTDQYNSNALTGLHTFLPVKVFPEEIPETIDLWFSDIMDLWMGLDQNKNWEKNTLVPMVEHLTNALPGYISFKQWLPEIFNKILRSFELPVGEAWKKWGPAAAPMGTGSIPGIIIK